MAKQFLIAVFVGALLAIGSGCGGHDDESIFMPTPTQGPPTPTPLPLCEGLNVPPGLGCRPFAWQEPDSSNNSPTQLFSTLPTADPNVFNFLPSLAPAGIDPGGNFIDLPPGVALVADGFPDPVSQIVGVNIDILPQNQPIPGFVIIGLKPLLDYICLKIELESVEGKLYCGGSTEEGIDTRITAAAGVTPAEDDVIEFPLGNSAPPGSLFLKFRQQQGRIPQGARARYENCFTLPECAPGQRLDCYRVVQEVAFTTGTAFGMKGTTPLLNSQLTPGLSGEPFNCSAWETPGGPGMLVQGLVDFDNIGGNVATALRISD